MNHKPNVALVDPHTEGGGGQDEWRLAAHELVLDPSPLVPFQVTVITNMGNLPDSEQFTESFEGSNQSEVDNTTP